MLFKNSLILKEIIVNKNNIYDSKKYMLNTLLYDFENLHNSISDITLISKVRFYLIHQFLKNELNYLELFKKYLHSNNYLIELKIVNDVVELINKNLHEYVFLLKQFILIHTVHTRIKIDDLININFKSYMDE